MYFTQPSQLLEIFSRLEERNLFLIQNVQETEVKNQNACFVVVCYNRKVTLLLSVYVCGCMCVCVCMCIYVCVSMCACVQ